MTAGHGTYSGYQRHRRASEDACDACRDALTNYQRIWRDRNSRAYRKAKDAANRRSRALTILGRRHPTELRQIIDELKAGDQ